MNTRLEPRSVERMAGTASTPVLRADPRRRPATEALGRRRTRILVAKLVLPVAAVCLLLSMTLLPGFDAVTDQARISFRRLSAEIEGAVVTAPRYRGVDEQDRPYTVTAESARQSKPNHIDLVVPRADITMEDGHWFFLKSIHGTLEQEQKQLDLWKDVVLYRDDGTALSTETMSIDLKTGTATSDQKVRVEGPMGTITADGFSFMDRGATVNFVGPAEAVLRGAER